MCQELRWRATRMQQSFGLAVAHSVHRKALQLVLEAASTMRGRSRLRALGRRGIGLRRGGIGACAQVRGVTATIPLHRPLRSVTGAWCLLGRKQLSLGLLRATKVRRSGCPSLLKQGVAQCDIGGEERSGETWRTRTTSGTPVETTDSVRVTGTTQTA